MNMDMRNSAEDQSQRMLNAIEPGSPVPIHRHRHSSETVVCLRGRFRELYYDDAGALTDVIEPDMQLETDARTAADLKDRIKKARMVIYVVTNDSLKSVRCGWEIGYADCDKGVEDVAILAIKPNNGRWKKHE